MQTYRAEEKVMLCLLYDGDTTHTEANLKPTAELWQQHCCQGTCACVYVYSIYASVTLGVQAHHVGFLQ